MGRIAKYINRFGVGVSVERDLQELAVKLEIDPSTAYYYGLTGMIKRGVVQGKFRLTSEEKNILMRKQP
jgi:hypothetical protein